MEMKKILEIGTLAMALTGCGPSKGKFSDSYQPKIIQQVERIERTEQATSQLEGKIMKVQSSSLSFRVGSSLSETTLSGNHEFEYVIVKDKEGKTRTLIYPYSKAILEGDVNIQYRELPLGVISTEDFVKYYGSSV